MPFLALLMLAAVSRPFHPVTPSGIATSTHSHVEVCGVVTLAKWEADGDRHIRISDDTTFVVAEIVPYHPLPSPKVGQLICVDGLRRYDDENGHGWWEVHPVEKWRMQ